MDTYVLKPGNLSSHGLILRFMERFPLHVSILDVGAASGYLGNALAQRGFRDLSGIEMDPEAARKARPSYKSLAVCDLEREPLPWPPSRFDIVICADVLEHLRDPEAALRKLVPLLKPDGWLVASLPNVAHWSVRLSLLTGRFPYAGSGLLDRGHLRFFTKQTARGLLGQSGLALRWERATPLPFARWYSGSRWKAPLRLLEGIDALLAKLRPTLFGYQFLLCAQKNHA